MPASTLDVTTLAKILDITPRTVQQLTQDGILQRARDEDGAEIRGRYNLLSVRDYCRYLRGLAKLDDASESVKIVLQNRKRAAEAEMSELKLREYKGTLHEASDVEFVMTNMLTFFKQRVLAIPARIARQLIGKTKFQEIYDALMTEIVMCLKELSGYDPAMFAAQTAARLAEQGVDPVGLNGNSDQTPPVDDDDDKQDGWIEVGPIVD
jgi:phage terminase Nu1 subunit (DNA packaging protein)